MKNFFKLIILLTLPFTGCAQKTNINSLYSEAMTAYNLGDYKSASEKFKIITNENHLDSISSDILYNGACVFSLNQDKKLALKVLEHLANNRLYSNLEHLTTDTDLNNIHNEPKWKNIVKKVTENKNTEPERLRKNIASELIKAKNILLEDNGKLWGAKIWSDDILVLGFDNTIYSLKPLINSKTTDGIIYYKTIPENTLAFSNAAQKYNGKDYAIVLTNYLDDNSSTIIHELFHVLQHKYITLNGNPIEYLDNYDAREWLRLEYQSLKNALNAINLKNETAKIETYVNDALIFRKLRQTKYKAYLQNEIEIETSEGLANYTGFILSTYPNKYKTAISEINQREQAQTYTRPFPYATGPAYGLIFDYLDVNWKIGLETIYNFLDIYETKYLIKDIKTSDSAIQLAQESNNYGKIHKEELERKIKNEKLIKYYTDLFVKKPTMSVKLNDSLYGRTFDMNGTIILKDKGIVYSMIKGVDDSNNNFGNFSTINGKEKLGVSGVLISSDGQKYTFPLPIKIEKNKVIGEFYTIELNKGWEITQINEKGDMEIIKKKK